MADTKTLSLRISPELLEKIDELVEQDGQARSRNAVLKKIIEAGIEAITGDQKAAEAAKNEELIDDIMKKMTEGDFVQAIATKVTEDVSAQVRKDTDELYRDLTTNLAATVLPTAIRAETKGFEETLHKIEEATVITVEEIPENPKALPEIDGSTASVPGETSESKEIVLDEYGFLDQWAIRRVRGVGLVVSKP